MEETPNNNQINYNMSAPSMKNPTPEKPTSQTTIFVLFIISIALSVIGLGLGIFGTIQANRAMDAVKSEYLQDTTKNSNEATDEDSDEEESYGKPNTANSIDYVGVIYNDGNDYVEIYDDDTALYYSAYEEDDNDNEVSTDSKKVFQNVFNNYLQYLGNNEIQGDETWGISVSSSEGSSFIGGTGNAPEWFNKILIELDVENNGYQSNN